MLTPQFVLPLHHELVIDLFAGGGGASTGIEQAIGRPVDVAINHDREAVSFPASYIIERGADGRALTKTAQVRLCGNSVCPPIARALVAANFAEAARERKVA